MPSLLVSILIAAAAAAAVIGPPRRTLVALVMAWLLVPGGARLPGDASGPWFIHRIILAAAVVGLVHQLIRGNLDRRVFAVRGVHLAFAAYLAIAFTNGVLLAEHRTPYSVNVNSFLGILEQAVFFVVMLALVRAVGAQPAAVTIAAVAGALAAITVSEHMFEWSYAEWFSRHLFNPDGLLRLPLETRGTHFRVRGPATFALEFGWVAAMLLPLTAAVALTHRRLTLAWFVPAGLGLSVIWSWTRSAYSALAIGAVLILLGVVVGRTRRLAIFGLSALVLLTLLVQGALRETIDLGAANGEADPRLERLPSVFGAVAHRPFTGLGGGGLIHRGVPTVDISWILTYATLGVVGVIALGALLLSAIHAVTRFTSAEPSARRTLAAGAAAAAVTAPVGLFALDFASLRTATETLWGLTAVALVASEELGVLPPRPLRRRGLLPPLAVALGAVGLVAGTVAAFTVPPRTTITATFTTVAPRISAVGTGSPNYTFKVLSQSACIVVEAAQIPATVRCQDLDQRDGGVGLVVLDAPSTADANRAVASLRAQLREGFRHSTLEVMNRGRGRPNLATTAPLWLAAVGFALGAIATDRRAPLMRYQHRQRALAPPTPDVLSGALGDGPPAQAWPVRAPRPRTPPRTTRGD